MHAATRFDQEVNPMKLVRIVCAGALLFAVGCELPEEGELATEQRVDSTNSDDSIYYQSEDLEANLEVDALDYAMDDTMALSSDTAVIWVEEEFTDDQDVLGGGGKKKWECKYCYKWDCYKEKHKKKYKAKKEAKEECEDEHDHGCKYKGCWKTW
jgi:hypothetical protein